MSPVLFKTQFQLLLFYLVHCCQWQVVVLGNGTVDICWYADSTCCIYGCLPWKELAR